ncbi:MAG: T9SS type A sorting domain-containing protein [Bacteroidetes bacterium]|nr:T9SS type A sorting domain-containing protein [Bacteroidota bacterium]
MTNWDRSFSTPSSTTIFRALAWVIALTMAMLGSATAQPNLTFKRIVNNWPTIELYYTVACSGAPVWNLNQGDFRLYDAGKEVPQFTMHCADPTVACPMSTALVFDASGSMAGAGNAGIIQAGKAFVGTMDGATDEAAIAWFNQNATLQQGMTGDTASLNRAIDLIPATGPTVLWDGIWAGLQEVQTHGSNSCRAVVVISDGGDNSSMYTPAQLITFANQNHIRVFTIGLGSGLNPIDLQLIAELTGGKYYQALTPASLVVIYPEIASIIHMGFLECRIDYDATCADGAVHTVELQVNNVCGGSDVKSKSYRAPRDTTTFSELPLTLTDTTVTGGEDFAVPFTLPSQLSGEVLTALTFDLCYNTHMFEFRGVEIPAGGLLDGMSATAGPIACGRRIQTVGSKLVNGSGVLLQLKFRSITNPNDTVTSPFTVSGAWFESGCLTPLISGATVTVLPRPFTGEAILSPRCYVPDSLHFDTSVDGYIPNPFTVQLSCVNNGTDTAFAVTGTLQLPDGLDLVSATEPLTKPIYTAPLAPWRVGDPVPSISWMVRWTKREAHDVDLGISFVVGAETRTGAKVADVPVSCTVRIAGLRKEVFCGMEMPDALHLNVAGDSVKPNPFTIRYWVRNIGQTATRLNTLVLIGIADGLSLAPTSPYGMGDPIAVPLQPGDSAEFIWIVDVQNRSYPRSFVIKARTLDSDGDVHLCERHLFIPSLPQGALDCGLYTDSITADYTKQVYIPMPFAVTLTAFSNKAALSDSVWARIVIPSGGLALAGPDIGIFAKPLSPALLFPQQQGSVQWMLTHPLSTQEVRYTVRTMLWEKGGDTTFCETEVLIPAMPAPFWFTLSPSGPIAFCEGGQVVLNAGAGYATYLWSTSDTTQAITVSQSGTYWCGVTAADGLPGLSDQVTVTVYPLPATPLITRSGDVLTTDPASAWQWYRDGNEIPGASAQSLPADQTGEYQVRITDINGCEALSDVFAVGTLDVDEGQTPGQRFTLYPNPVEGVLTIDVVIDHPAPVRLVVRDLLGRELWRISRDAESRSFTERLDLRGLRSGVYLVQLEAGGGVQARLVVVR